MITFIPRFCWRGAEMARTSDVERSADQNHLLVWSTFHLLRINFLPLRLVGLEDSTAPYE